MSRTKVCKKFSSGKISFSTFSLTLSGQLTDFELKFFRHALSESQCTCPKKHNEGKQNEKNYGLYYFWCFWAEDFCASDKIVEAVFPELHLTYPGKNFGGTYFQKNLVSYLCLVFERKHSVFSVETFSILLKTASYVYRRLLVVFWFILWFMKTLDFEPYIFGMTDKSLFLPLQKVVGETFFEKTTVLSILVHFGQKIFTHRTKNFGSALEFALCVSRITVLKESLSGKNFVSNFPLTLSCTLSDFELIFFKHALFEGRCRYPKK